MVRSDSLLLTFGSICWTKRELGRQRELAALTPVSVFDLCVEPILYTLVNTHKPGAVVRSSLHLWSKTIGCP